MPPADPAPSSEPRAPLRDLETASKAYAAIEPELASVAEDDASRIVRVDIPAAVSRGLGALPALEKLRPAFAEQLGPRALELVDRLEAYALAAWYAFTLAKPKRRSASPLQPLFDEAIALRKRLLVAAEALAVSELIDAERLAPIRRSGKGHLQVANALLALAVLFRQCWAEVASRTAISCAEIEEAERLGGVLLREVGVRQRAREPGAAAEAAERCRRAFALYARAYDGCRQAVGYVRWHHGDADAILPSLYATRGVRRSS